MMVLQRITIWAVALASIIAACASSAIEGEANGGIFKNPDRWLGRTVKVCGYFRVRFEDTNIWQSKGQMERGESGIGFKIAKNANSSDYDDKNRCAVGTIVRTGCGAEKICTWSIYPYALQELNSGDRDSGDT